VRAKGAHFGPVISPATYNPRLGGAGIRICGGPCADWLNGAKKQWGCAACIQRGPRQPAACSTSLTNSLSSRETGPSGLGTGLPEQAGESLPLPTSPPRCGRGLVIFLVEGGAKQQKKQPGGCPGLASNGQAIKRACRGPLFSPAVSARRAALRRTRPVTEANVMDELMFPHDGSAGERAQPHCLCGAVPRKSTPRFTGEVEEPARPTERFVPAAVEGRGVSADALTRDLRRQRSSRIA